MTKRNVSILLATLLVMAGAVIAAIPTLVIYIMLQRFIVQSVANAGLKG